MSGSADGLACEECQRVQVHGNGTDDRTDEEVAADQRVAETPFEDARPANDSMWPVAPQHRLQSKIKNAGE